MPARSRMIAQYRTAAPASATSGPWRTRARPVLRRERPVAYSAAPAPPRFGSERLRDEQGVVHVQRRDQARVAVPPAGRPARNPPAHSRFCVHPADPIRGLRERRTNTTRNPESKDRREEGWLCARNRFYNREKSKRSNRGAECARQRSLRTPAGCVALTAAVLAIVIAPAAQARGSSPAAMHACAAATQLQAMVCLINQTRAAHGLPGVRLSTAPGDRRHCARPRSFKRLAVLAHALRAVVRGACSGLSATHACSARTSRGVRASPASPQQAVNAWLASPPHRRVLLSRGWRELGVSAIGVNGMFAPGANIVWVAQFGSRHRSAAGGQTTAAAERPPSWDFCAADPRGDRGRVGQRGSIQTRARHRGGGRSRRRRHVA